MATRPFAKEERFKSWLYTVSTMVLLIMMFFGTYRNFNFGLQIICGLCTPFIFSRMFVIYHDYLHNAILNRSWLAKLVFWQFGIFTLAPVSVWKRGHNHHHKHNSKFVKGDGPYPLMTKAQYLNANKLTRFRYLASRHPLNLLMAYFTIFLYGMCLQPFLKSPVRHYDCFIALLVHFGFAYYLLITGGMTAYMLTLFIPFNMAFALGAYLFYVQHNFPEVVFLKKNEWSYERAALESSSYLEMGRFMHWATGNIGYHHIHHLNCTIPFYRLPEAMERIPELQNVKKTSLHWRDVLACLRLKLWDPELNRMITLKEVSSSQNFNHQK